MGLCTLLIGVVTVDADGDDAQAEVGTEFTVLLVTGLFVPVVWAEYMRGYFCEGTHMVQEDQHRPAHRG
jgi:hypothetical protein